MADKVEVVKKKGTPKTEAIVGAGVAKLEKLIQDATKIGSQFGELVKLSEEQSLKIAEAEQRLIDINTQAIELRRKQSVENEIAYQENKGEFVRQYLASKNLVPVSQQEYNDLTNEVTRLKADQVKEISKAEAIIGNTLKRNYEQDLKLKEQEYIAKEATNTATINQLKEKVTFLEGQVINWKQQLDAERTASVERAKASSVGAINLSAGK
jgi:hypothetical protein